MAWQDQGRQGHGWFGDGTGPGALPPGLADRAGAVAATLVAALPAGLRNKASAVLDAGARTGLRNL